MESIKNAEPESSKTLDDYFVMLSKVSDPSHLSVFAGFLVRYIEQGKIVLSEAAPRFFIVFVVAATIFFIVGDKFDSPWARFSVNLVGWLAVVMLFFASMDVLPFLSQLIGARLARYYVLDQQDRALAGLSINLNYDVPLILYLRSFGEEREKDAYLKIDDCLARFVDGNYIVLAINDPEEDMFYRFSPLPKIYVRQEYWMEVVRLLVERAEMIVVALGNGGDGLDYEIQTIKNLEAERKTILLHVNGPDERRNHDDFVASFPYFHDVYSRPDETHGEMVRLLVSTKAFAFYRGYRLRQRPLRLFWNSCVRKYTLERLFLYGMRKLWPPRNDLRSLIKFYRNSFVLNAELDLWPDIRNGAEDLRKKSDTILRIKFDSFESEDQEIRASAERWNHNVDLGIVYDNAMSTVSRWSFWWRLRKQMRVGRRIPFF